MKYTLGRCWWEESTWQLYPWISTSRRVSPIGIQVSCAAPCPGKAGALSLSGPIVLPIQFWKTKKQQQEKNPQSCFLTNLEHICDLRLLAHQQLFPVRVNLFSGSDLPPKSQDVWLKWHFRHFPSAKVTLNTIAEELERATCRQARKSDSRAGVVWSHLKSRHILFLTFQETECLLCPPFRVTWKSETLKTGKEEKTDYFRPCCCPEQFFLFSI